MPAPASRVRRLLRGWCVASIATFGGASAHAAAGGHLPGLAALALCWALAGLLCTLLAGRRHRTLGTALGVVGSQAALHWILDRAASMGAGAAGGPVPGGHLHHLSIGAAAPAQHSAADPLMVLLHLGVALATLAYIRRGEAAVTALADAVRLGLQGLWRLPVLRRPLPRLGPPPLGRAPQVLAPQACPGPVSARGPPVPSLP